MSRAEIARERLFSNLSALMEDVEELINATAEQTDERMLSVRERILRTLGSVKDTLTQTRRALHASVRRTQSMVSYIQDHCWARTAMLAGAAMLLECILRVRCARRCAIAERSSL